MPPTVSLTGCAAGPRSTRSAAVVAVPCTSSAPQSTSCCVRRASISALSSSAPQSGSVAAASAGRAVTGGAAAATVGRARADCGCPAAAAVVAPPGSLPSARAGTGPRLVGGACAAAAAPCLSAPDLPTGCASGLATRGAAAAVLAAALPQRLLGCCCWERGSLRGDQPPLAPLRLPLLPSTRRDGGGCASAAGCRPACSDTGSPAAASSTGAALPTLLRASTPRAPVTLPPLLVLLPAGWAPWLPWREGPARAGLAADAVDAAMGFQLDATSPDLMRSEGGEIEG